MSANRQWLEISPRIASYSPERSEILQQQRYSRTINQSEQENQATNGVSRSNSMPRPTSAPVRPERTKPARFSTGRYTIGDSNRQSADIVCNFDTHNGSVIENIDNENRTTYADLSPSGIERPSFSVPFRPPTNNDLLNITEDAPETMKRLARSLPSMTVKEGLMWKTHKKNNVQNTGLRYSEYIRELSKRDHVSRQLVHSHHYRYAANLRSCSLSMIPHPWFIIGTASNKSLVCWSIC